MSGARGCWLEVFTMETSMAVMKQFWHGLAMSWSMISGIMVEEAVRLKGP